MRNVESLNIPVGYQLVFMPSSPEVDVLSRSLVSPATPKNALSREIEMGQDCLQNTGFWQFFVLTNICRHKQVFL